jgi:hypothetical protein
MMKRVEASPRFPVCTKNMPATAAEPIAMNVPSNRFFIAP